MSSVWAADLGKKLLVVPLIVTQSRKDSRPGYDPYAGGPEPLPILEGSPLGQEHR